jgi:ferredoxin
MPYIITELCTNDGACVEVCPVACIHTKPGDPQHYIDPDVCIECEQCEIVCPVDAIFLDWKLPAEYQESIEVNAAFFRQNKVVAGPPPLSTAWEMIEASERYARENGAAVSVAIVDAAGSLIALSRMDGAAPWTPELAVSKANTSVNFLLPTQELVDDARQPWFRSLTVRNHGRILGAGGGIPILDGVLIVGAIGVAGGKNAEQDVLCARAGLGVIYAPVH